MPSRSLSELATLTGLKPRTLQFWAQSGVIVPEAGTVHRGPGVHRKFSQIEAEIACILAAITPFSLQVGALLSISTKVREAATYGSTFSDEEALSIAKIESRRRLRNRLPMMLEAENLSEEEKQSAMLPPQLSEDEYESLGTYVAMLMGREAVAGGILIIGFEGEKVIARGTGPTTWDTSFVEKLPATLWIDLRTILPKAQT